MDPRPLTRRALLVRLGAATAAASVPGALWDPVRAAAMGRAQLASVTDPTGTTLELSIRRPGGSGYLKLVEAEPYTQVLREELVAAKAGRDGRRVALASIVHLTDVHLVDAQSPTRVEFTDRLPGPFESAFRPQETLTTQVASSMVQGINAIASGPVTGRPFDVAVSTGDNIDNQQRNELEWFMTVLDGGTITPNSGDPDHYEGVQDATIGLGYYNNYWHPDPPPLMNPPDGYKADFGFPELPGLLDGALATFDTSALGVPWYSAYGNHDGLLQGNAPGELPGNVHPFDAVATGPLKITAVATSLDPADLSSALGSLPGLLQDPSVLARTGLVRVVTPDAERRAATLADWIQRHLDSPDEPGPAGHGYTADMIASRQLYYTFPISESVLGICLDTINHGGYADGSLGDTQLSWLERQLVAAHSTYYDAGGAKVTTNADDRLVVLISHHNLFTLGNPVPDPFAPTDALHGFDVLQALLRRFPNVVAWVNGHSHVNRITPVPDPTGQTGGFWEISTAAHIDWPEHARLIEIVDNCDGTLSIFGTLIEHASPASVDITDPASASVTQLASLSRELSANEPQASMAAVGAPLDRNVELLIRSPFTICMPPAPTPDPGPGSGAGGSGRLPATGGAAVTGAAAALAAAGGAALALRRRVERDAQNPPAS
jgi:metallophosphoesterase (TIGR03767 family)